MLAGVVLWVILAYLVVAEPFIGRRMYKRLQAGKTPRTRFYWLTIWLEWGLVVVTVLVYLFGRIPLRLLGLYNPNGFFMPPGILGGIVIGLVAGVVVGILLALIQRLRGSQTMQGRAGHVEALLPHTNQELRIFVLVAITAGVCEEILFRGLPVYLLNHYFPNLGPILVVVITACIFGLAHIYQGWKGVLSTGLIGFVFAAVYLATGALWLPMICHALIDLRAALLPAPKETA